MPISIRQEAILFLALNTSENSSILQQNTSIIGWSRNWILRHHVFYFYLSIYDQGLISGVYLFCENFFSSTRKINLFEKKINAFVCFVLKKKMVPLMDKYVNRIYLRYSYKKNKSIKYVHG